MVLLRTCRQRPFAALLWRTQVGCSLEIHNPWASEKGQLLFMLLELRPNAVLVELASGPCLSLHHTWHPSAPGTEAGLQLYWVNQHLFFFWGCWVERARFGVPRGEQGLAPGKRGGERAEGGRVGEGGRGSFISMGTRVTSCFSLPGTQGAGTWSLKTEGVVGKRGQSVPHVESWAWPGPESVPASQLP